MPKISSVKSPFPILDTPLHEPNDVQSSEAFPAAGNNEELGVSFDQPMQADTLHSANKVTLVFKMREKGIKDKPASSHHSLLRFHNWMFA